jgi:hypothetical protein
VRAIGTATCIHNQGSQAGGGKKNRFGRYMHHTHTHTHTHTHARTPRLCPEKLEVAILGEQSLELVMHALYQLPGVSDSDTHTGTEKERR